MYLSSIHLHRNILQIQGTRAGGACASGAGATGGAGCGSDTWHARPTHPQDFKWNSRNRQPETPDVFTTNSPMDDHHCPKQKTYHFGEH